MIRNKIALTAAIAACCLLGRVSIAEAQDAVLVGCSDGGCTKKVCRPIVENKTVTRRVYSDVKEDFCVPCSAFSCLLPNKCGCSHVHTRKILVVKLRKCDKCVTKCVPVIEPVCTAPCSAAPCESGCQPAAPIHVQGQMPAITTMPSGPVAMPPGR